MNKEEGLARGYLDRRDLDDQTEERRRVRRDMDGFLDWTVWEMPGVTGGSRIFRGLKRPDRFFSPMHWESAETISTWQDHPQTGE